MPEVETDRPASFPWAFVGLTYAISWTIWIAGWFALGKPGRLTEGGAIFAVILAGSFGPGLAAAILTLRGGRAEFLAWAHTFVKFRCGWRAYAAAFLPFPLAVLLLTVLLGYEPLIDALGGQPAWAFYATIFPAAILNGIVAAVMGAGPIGEEGGWRGYLLPRLLESGGELRASLIIGVIWALWHLPPMAMFSDWRDGIPFWTYLPLYLVSVIALSFLFTRVWLIGRGSLVPIIWLHGIVNAIGPMAFNDRVWASLWPHEAAVLFFAAAGMIAAASIAKGSK
jgi:membrane protease YdiL (CAAX protease family)